MGGDASQVAQGAQRIFEMIEEADTKNEIEGAAVQYGVVLDIGTIEGDLGIAASGFQDIVGAAIETDDGKPEGGEKFGEVADAAADVGGGFDAEGVAEMLKDGAENALASFGELQGIGMIEDGVIWQRQRPLE